MGTEYLSLSEQSARPSDYDQFPKSVIFSYRETEKSKTWSRIGHCKDRVISLK